MSAFLHALAETLGLSESDTRAALAAFARNVRARAEEEDVTYEGLGTFRLEAGLLTFEPDASVALVVNHRYAGMEPIPLSGGVPPAWQQGLPDEQHPLGPPPQSVFETADADTVENAPSDEAGLPPLFASDETLMALRDAARDLETPPRSDTADQWAADMIEEEEEDAPAYEDAPVPDEPEPVVDEPVVDEPVVDEPVVDEPVVDEPVVDEPVVDEPVVAPPPPVSVYEESDEETSPPPAPVAPLPVRATPVADHPIREPRSIPAPQPRRMRVWPLVLLALLAIAAVIAVVLLRSDSPPTPVQPPVAVVDSAAVADSAAAAAIPADTVAAAPPVEEGPLRGTTPVTEGQGYTIIVGGTTSEAAATTIAEPFQQQGFRTGIIPGRTRAGASIYRIGVGQFGSIDEASRALAELSGTLPSDAWVYSL